MRRFWVFALFLLFLVFPHQAYGFEGWVVDSFQAQVTVEKSGVVGVVENIGVDFGSLSKHGIYRDIPYIYDSGAADVYTEVDVESVLQNSVPAKFEVSKTNGYIRLKIGDPNRTITGTNFYVINYKVKGVLKSFADHDELYWNVTGNNWPVGITKAWAIVKLPEDGILQADCFEGSEGSDEKCRIINLDARSAQFDTTKNLQENQGLTAVVGFKKGMVPILTVERPVSFWEKFVSWPSQLTLLTALLFGIGTIVYLWFKYGRDYWFAANLFGSKNEKGEVKPIDGYETVVVEFLPPDKLRPAEIGVVMDEIAHTHDVTATIIDLASRGYLSITEEPKKWIFGTTDYILHKKSKDPKELLKYEKMLLDKLFKDGETVSVSSLKTKFYEELKEVKEELYRHVVEKKLFPTDPDKVRTKYLAIAILMVVAGVFAIIFGISIENIFVADLSLGVIISGIILIGVSKFMPRRTAYGRDVYRRVQGYRLFISKAETYRQRFFEKKNLFNEVLPYAIVFGLTGKFAQAMKDMGVQTSQPSWYTGAHAFNTIGFANSMNSFSSSMSSAIASAPSSSGFSGGGSSGGGFGGGGGGSW